MILWIKIKQSTTASLKYDFQITSFFQVPGYAVAQFNIAGNTALVSYYILALFGM